MSLVSVERSRSVVSVCRIYLSLVSVEYSRSVFSVCRRSLNIFCRLFSKKISTCPEYSMWCTGLNKVMTSSDLLLRIKLLSYGLEIPSVVRASLYNLKYLRVL